MGVGRYGREAVGSVAQIGEGQAPVARAVHGDSRVRRGYVVVEIDVDRAAGRGGDDQGLVADVLAVDIASCGRRVGEHRRSLRIAVHHAGAAVARRCAGDRIRHRQREARGRGAVARARSRREGHRLQVVGQLRGRAGQRVVAVHVRRSRARKRPRAIDRDGQRVDIVAAIVGVADRDMAEQSDGTLRRARLAARGSRNRRVRAQGDLRGGGSAGPEATHRYDRDVALAADRRAGVIVGHAVQNGFDDAKVLRRAHRRRKVDVQRPDALRVGRHDRAAGGGYFALAGGIAAARQLECELVVG